MSGVAAILTACALNVVVAAGFYYAGIIDPTYSPLSGICIRILANLTCLLPALWLGRGLPRFQRVREEYDLWTWALLSLAGVATYYFGVTLLGPGQATLLHAGSGVFIIAFAPLITRQETPRLHQVAGLGCMLGIAMLIQANPGERGTPFGYSLALASGVFTSLAYLTVARGGSKHSPESVTLHWTAANLAVAGVVSLVYPYQWPTLTLSWVLLVTAGLCAAASQYLTALAYQRSGASLIACLSFSGPLLSVIVDLLIFKLPVSAAAISGMAAILLCGLIVPLSRVSGTSKSLGNRIRTS